MRKRIRAAVLGAVLAGGAGCGGGPPNPYPDEVVDNFVTACRANAPEKVCTCAIDRIQRRFTLDEFRAFEQRLAQGETPKELVDAVADCR
jgi:hypothetical protein